MFLSKNYKQSDSNSTKKKFNKFIKISVIKFLTQGIDNLLVKQVFLENVGNKKGF